MPIDHRDTLRSIRTFPSLVRYLRDEMGWPIDSDDFEEVTFDYTPDELGIDLKNAAKIEEIKRLRPLAANQPWGIFFVKFEPQAAPGRRATAHPEPGGAQEAGLGEAGRPSRVGRGRSPVHFQLRRGRRAADQLRALLAARRQQAICPHSR